MAVNVPSVFRDFTPAPEFYCPIEGPLSSVEESDNFKLTVPKLEEILNESGASKPSHHAFWRQGKEEDDNLVAPYAAVGVIETILMLLKNFVNSSFIWTDRFLANYAEQFGDYKEAVELHLDRAKRLLERADFFPFWYNLLSPSPKELDDMLQARKDKYLKMAIGEYSRAIEIMKNPNILLWRLRTESSINFILADVYRLRAEAKFRVGDVSSEADYQEAANRYNNAGRFADSADMHKRRADILENAERYSEAAEEYSQIIQLMETRKIRVIARPPPRPNEIISSTAILADIYKLRAEAKFRVGDVSSEADYQEAANRYNNAGRFADSADMHRRRADILENAERCSEAVDAYRKLFKQLRVLRILMVEQIGIQKGTLAIDLLKNGAVYLEKVFGKVFQPLLWQKKYVDVLVKAERFQEAAKACGDLVNAVAIMAGVGEGIKPSEDAQMLIRFGVTPSYKAVGDFLEKEIDYLIKAGEYEKVAGRVEFAARLDVRLNRVSLQAIDKLLFDAGRVDLIKGVLQTYERIYAEKGAWGKAANAVLNLAEYYEANNGGWIMAGEAFERMASYLDKMGVTDIGGQERVLEWVIGGAHEEGGFRPEKTAAIRERLQMLESLADQKTPPNPIIFGEDGRVVIIGGSVAMPSLPRRELKGLERAQAIYLSTYGATDAKSVIGTSETEDAKNIEKLADIARRVKADGEVALIQFQRRLIKMGVEPSELYNPGTNNKVIEKLKERLGEHVFRELQIKYRTPKGKDKDKDEERKRFK